MMRSFMTSGPLTWGAELNEGLVGSDTTPFPKENAVMTAYGGCPPHRGGVTCLAYALGPQLATVGDTRAQGCNDTSFPSS
jgi:hypothetical protein